MAIRRSLSAVAALLMSGCYYYVPIGVPNLELESNVRLELGSEWATRNAVGEWTRGTAYVDGRLLSLQPEALVLRTAGQSRETLFMAAIENSLNVPRNEIRGVQLKQLDRRKTSLFLVGAGVLATAFVVERLGGETGVRAGLPESPAPDAARIPFR